MGGKRILAFILAVLVTFGGLAWFAATKFGGRGGWFTSALASVCVIVGIIMLIKSDAAAKGLFYDRFEKIFNVSWSTSHDDPFLRDVTQAHVNTVMRSLAMEMQMRFGEQEQKRIAIKHYRGKLDEFELCNLKDQLHEVDKKVEGAKHRFSEARKAAEGKGFIVFSSHQPYLSESLMARCLPPTGDLAEKLLADARRMFTATNSIPNITLRTLLSQEEAGGYDRRLINVE